MPKRGSQQPTGGGNGGGDDDQEFDGVILREADFGDISRCEECGMRVYA